jgi:hypothetical protein
MNLWADKTDLQAAQNIARALRRNRGRVFGDWVISMGEIDQHTKNGTYRLDAKPPQTPREHRTDTATEKPKESKTYDEPISEHRTDTATEKPKESKTYDDPAVSAVLLRGLKDMCPKCGCGRISWGVDHGRCLNSNCGIKILPSGSGGTHTA